MENEKKGKGCATIVVVILLLIGYGKYIEATEKDKPDSTSSYYNTKSSTESNNNYIESVRENAIENARSNKNNENLAELWEQISDKFSGSVSAKEVRRYFTMLMNRHRLTIDEINVKKIANRLVAIKNNTNGTAPEIAVLRHMYNFGKYDVDLFLQLEASALTLNDIK